MSGVLPDSYYATQTESQDIHLDYCDSRAEGGEGKECWNPPLPPATVFSLSNDIYKDGINVRREAHARTYT